jgi:hypothetical protein
MKNNFEIGLTLEKILQKLEALDAKVSGIPQVQVQVSGTLLPTINALTNLGSGTASLVSQVTGKARAVESKRLNELYSMGLLNKQKQGRMIVFTLKQPSMRLPIEEKLVKNGVIDFANLKRYR